VDRRDISHAKAINQVGEHEVVVDLGYSIKATIKIKVTGNTDENFERASKTKRPRKAAVSAEAKEDKSE
jgi:hypothetical protein